VVGTLDKLGDAHARDTLGRFRYLVIDEAYQADSARYFGVAGIADRHLLVGDPGQLDPFTTMPDADRWRGLAEDPTQTAVAVVRANHPAVPVFQLPITRRLPPSAIPVVSAFYPDHPFAAWTLPGARSLTLMPAVRSGAIRVMDAALDEAAASGWAYVRLPESPVLTADPLTVDVITRLTARLMERGPTVRDERTGDRAVQLVPERVAVAVSHGIRGTTCARRSTTLDWPPCGSTRRTSCRAWSTTWWSRGIRWQACRTRTDSISTPAGSA
jgi:hypothetical protein